MKRRLVHALAALAVLSGCAREPARSPQTPREEGAGAASSSTHSGARSAGWILVAVGASAGAVAVGSSALMLYEGAVRSDECDEAKVCSAKGIEANERLDRYGPFNAGAWIVGAAAAGAGLYLLWTNPAEPSGTSVGVRASPGGAALEARF